MTLFSELFKINAIKAGNKGSYGHHRGSNALFGFKNGPNISILSINVQFTAFGNTK